EKRVGRRTRSSKYVRLLWCNDGAKWVCRNLSSHARLYDCSDGWNRSIILELYRSFSTDCWYQLIWNRRSRWRSYLCSIDCTFFHEFTSCACRDFNFNRTIDRHGKYDVNVNGSMVSGVITSRVLGNLNEDTLNDKQQVEKETAI